MNKIIHTTSLCPIQTTCPKAEFETDAVIVSDNGQAVRMTKEEFQILVDAAKTGAGWAIK